jgi:hypothetical protein
MIGSTILQITTRNVFDPFVILFFLGSALFLSAIWVVLRHPSSDQNDVSRKPAPPSDQDGAPRRRVPQKDPRSSRPAPRGVKRGGALK